MRRHLLLPFAALVMVLFAFALDNDTVLQRTAPGLVWLGTIFSLLIVVQRTFAVETADGALDALRVAGVSPPGIFLGKSMSLAVQLLVLEVLMLVLAIVLYGSSVDGLGAVLLVTTLIPATTGLAFVGTLYGGLAAGARGRETLLPLLMLPVVVRSTEYTGVLMPVRVDVWAKAVQPRAASRLAVARVLKLNDMMIS